MTTKYTDEYKQRRRIYQADWAIRNPDKIKAQQLRRKEKQILKKELKPILCIEEVYEIKLTNPIDIWFKSKLIQTLLDRDAARLNRQKLLYILIHESMTHSKLLNWINDDKPVGITVSMINDIDTLLQEFPTKYYIIDWTKENPIPYGPIYYAARYKSKMYKQSVKAIRRK